MPIDVQMPDGTIISGVPDNITQADLLKRYQAYAPPKVSAGAVPDELGRYDAAKQPVEGPPVANPQSGGMAALQGNAQQIQADITRLAGKLGIKDVAQAEREAKQYEAEKKRIYKPTEKSWSEDPLGNLSELAMGSAPYMAAPIAAGVAALALPEIGIAGGLIGTAELAAGAVGVGQFTGSNLSRQVQEGKTLEEASLLKAGAAAVPQAALDVFGLKMLPGIRQIFTKAGVEVSKKELEEVAKKGLLEQAGYYTLQTGKTMGAEGLTEAGQAVFERLQAGLNIADEDARKEYFENFVGGAVLGGAFSVPGHAYEAIKNKKPEQVIEESKGDLQKGITEEKAASTTVPETTQVGTAPESESRDIQAMVDELAGKDITQPASITETTPNAAPEITAEPNAIPPKEILFHYTEPKTNEIISVVMGGDNKLVNADTGKPISIKETDLIPGPPPVNIAPATQVPKFAVDDKGEKLSYPMFVDMADKGYQVYSFDNPRAYTDKSGKTFRTLEKDGVRIAIEPNKVLFKQEGKEYGRVGTAIGTEKDVTLEHLIVDKDKRGQGLAREVLQNVADIADKNGYTLYLEPTQLEKNGITSEQLSNLYAQYGFVASNNSGSPMVRQPNAETKAPEQTSELPETKSFQIAKPMEEIAAEVSKMKKGSQVAQWLIDNAPNTPALEIAKRVYANIKAIEDSGIPVKITVLNGAKRHSYYGSSQGFGLNGKLAYFSVEYNGLNAQGKAENGRTSGKPTGTRYSTLMHELLHVVSQIQLDTLMKRNYKGSDKAIYNDLRSVYRAVKEKIELDKKSTPRKDWHPLLWEVGTNNDKGALKDIHELLVRSLTEQNVQDYLANIKVGNKTALTKLMEAFRKLIGLDPKYQTALDKIITVSDKVFAQTPADIANYYTQYRSLSARKENLKIATLSNAGFTPERLKSIFSYYADYEYPGITKGYIGYVNPKEFLAATTTPEYLKTLEKEATTLDSEKLKEETQELFLNISEPKSYGSKIQGHEGRHRMIALMNAGFDKVPVVFNVRKWMDDAKPIGILPIGGQTFNSYDKEGNKTEEKGKSFYVEDLIPLSKNYRQEVMDKFVTPEAGIKFEEVTGGATGGEGRNYKGQPVQASWSFPEDNIKHWYGLSDEKIDNIIYKLQDKQIDTKRAQQMIEKEVGKIDDDLNVYDKEQLYHGRTATGIREFLLNELMPAIKQLQKLGLSPQEMREYLHNRHAQERNDKMNEINKLDPVTGKERKTPWELQDRASGIATADAKAYLAGLDPKKKTALEKVADMFDKMVKETQDILVKSGAETKETIDAWNSTYEHYVPLFRVEEDVGGFGTTGASKGFGTQGKFSKRAMGSEKEVQDILGNLIAQRERALIRSEKIKVGRALYALALKNPNPDLWLPVNPDAIKNKEALIKELMDLGFSDAADIANNLMDEPKSRYISKTKKIDPNTGLPLSDTEESVKLKVDNLKRFGENVFPIRINGKDRYIFFNQGNPTAVRMVQSLKNLDADSLGDIEGVIGRMTRWFASVNTQYNPIFGAVNLLRDVQGAMFNLSTTPLAGMQGKVSSGIIPAMRGIINVLRDERKGKTDTTGKWAKAFQDFRKQGGQTGYRESLIRTDEEKAIIEKEMGKIKEGNVKKAFGAVMGALTDFNDMMENSVRVSAYVAALDKGLSKQQAAIVAKNLTVNFDKKGQLSARINAYYAFFNASVQGTARLAQTLKGPMGRKIIAGGIGLGAMQAVMLAAAGYREDEPPEFVRERNFVIPMPDGKYLSIPYPLGLHILPNVGRITTEFVLGGGKNAGKKVANMTGAFMDAFSPVGSSGLSIQSVLPTVLDPIAALESNKDAFGRPIYREDRATNPMPGYLRSRESASEISKQISYFLNLASGGGKYSKGFLSPTADELDYIAGQLTGGVGRELIKTEQAIKAGVTGEELPTYRIPLAGRFIGDTESKAAESQRFYGNITRMADHEHEVKGRQKNKENVMEYYRDHPEARFWQMANNVENEINALNKQKKEFQEKGFPKERIQRIDNQKALKMKRFNDFIAKYEE